MMRHPDTYCSWFDYADMSLHMPDNVVPYTQGLDAVTRNSVWGQDSAILTFVIGILLLSVFALRHFKRFFSDTWRSLTDVRERANVFDDHTIDKSGAVASLNLMACVGEAIMLITACSTIGIEVEEQHAFVTLLALTGLMCVYAVTQYAVYWTLGFVFTSGTMRSNWLSGFSAVQSMLGITLFAPALAAMFYPGEALQFVVVGAIIYICWRIVFIFKGFRIFFHNYFSLVYFILYLCSVEIIPLLLLYRSSVTICQFLN